MGLTYSTIKSHKQNETVRIEKKEKIDEERKETTTAKNRLKYII